MSYLRKIANVDELGEINMPQDILNQILYNIGEDISVGSIVYRRLMNSNTRFTVEVWVMSDNTFCVFSGEFDGMWTVSNIEYNGNFSSEAEAESFVQANLQSKADFNEVVMVQSRLKKNDFMRKHAAGKEPDYEEIAKGFASTIDVSVPDIEKGHASSLNKYYDDFESYMKKYYPEWAKYPAFIWGGWGYFVDSYNNQENKEEKPEEDTQVENQQEEQNEQVEQIQQTDVTPTVDVSMDMGSDSSN
ncbi:gp238 [Bacillus phage G]|uniref:Gp238 n=1 Tax=Bacillus phage G TaxID=2884420 RepID=G3M9X9_9CAUD|nr:gp238 [Bacillus phage G]AEO93497.1 gp238 [Bacillus phage G]